MFWVALGATVSLGWLALHYQVKFKAACEEIDAAYDWIDEIVEELQKEQD